MIAIIDYGAGNLFSVCNALDALEAAHTVTSEIGRASCRERVYVLV